MHANFLEGAIQTFRLYEMLGRRTIDQLDDEQVFAVPAPESNSIAIMVQHVHGNMLSRFTDFLTSDGEKPWRERDREFEAVANDRGEVEKLWREGWARLFETLESLEPDDVERIVVVRNEECTVVEALQRQLTHYAYHVGQMVFLGKMLRGADWQTLSVPKGGSAEYNAKKFAQEKGRRHFTEGWLDEEK